MSDISWIFEDIVAVPHARHAVLLSADGLVAGASEGIDRTTADHAAAIGAGMQALSRNAADFAHHGSPATPWQQTLIEWEDALVILSAAGNGSYMVVSASPNVDIAALTYQISKSIDRLHGEMHVPERHTQAPA